MKITRRTAEMDEVTKDMVKAQLKSAIFALPSFGLVETSNSVGKDRRKLGD